MPKKNKTTKGLGCNYLLDVLGVSKHTHPHLGTRNMGQLHRATETFVFLGVVVLQTNLKFHGLRELAVLLLGTRGNLGDSLPENIALKLTARQSKQATITTQTLRLYKSQK